MDFSSFLIVDCRTTIWEKASDQPAGQTNELIQLDAALIDTNKNQLVEYDSFVIKPKKSKVSEYCKKLFGLDQSAVDRGISFQEVYRRLRIHYMSRDRMWGTWGLFDKGVLDKQCKQLDLENLFTQPHTDLQRLYSMMVGTHINSNAIAVHQALEYSGVLRENNQAVNIANLYMRMAKGLRQIPKHRIVVPSGYGKAA